MVWQAVVTAIIPGQDRDGEGGWFSIAATIPAITSAVTPTAAVAAAAEIAAARGEIIGEFAVVPQATRRFTKDRAIVRRAVALALRFIRGRIRLRWLAL